MTHQQCPGTDPTVIWISGQWWSYYLPDDMRGGYWYCRGCGCSPDKGGVA